MSPVAYPTTQKRNTRTSFAWIILICFFFSGASGLIYQVIWVRELELVFGATTFATSTVLTAFMSGLALGSYYFGRRADGGRAPLALYGLLEISIGIYGLTIPYIFAALHGIYEPIIPHLLANQAEPSGGLGALVHFPILLLTLIRFLVAMSVLLVPTALMGATLPVLASYYATETAQIGLRVGQLYSINTSGAVVGAALAGFLMIPALGMRLTTYAAAAINIALGLTAGAVNRRNRHKSSVRAGLMMDALDSSGPGATGASGRRVILAVLGSFAASGFVALCYEVIWSRVLALIIGSSVYAFSIMLTTFLVGLAAGSSIGARFADRLRRPIAAFGVVQLGIGLASLGGAYLFNELPYAFVGLYRWLSGSNVAILLLARLLISAMVMFVPTLLLGLLFPLVVRIVHGGGAVGERRDLPDTAKIVGNVYAVNTVGAILGAFCSGFVLIPFFGLLGSLRVSVATNFLLAGVLLVAGRSGAADDARKQEANDARKSRGRKARRQQSRRAPISLPSPYWAGAVVSILLLVFAVEAKPAWDIAVMSSGVYRYAPQVVKMDRSQFFDYFSAKGQGETVFYKEGLTATVVVQSKAGGRVLKVNGKPDASTAGDLPTQVLIGSLPLLLRPHTGDCLVIGLGSGVTLGSVEQFPVRAVTCVELEPAVVEASHSFDDLNHRPLLDPRLSLIENDGRNFIETTNKKFDVIVSEPSNPWLTGAASLFTLEYFKRGAAALTDDGLFSQWLQVYEMASQDVRSLIATFKAAFADVFLFRGAEGDLMLLGSKHKIKLDLDTIRAHMADKRVAADLDRIDATSPADIVSRFYMGPGEIGGFSSRSKLNTDDNALIEFRAPRQVGIDEDTVNRNVKELLAGAASPLPYLEGSFGGGAADPPGIDLVPAETSEQTADGFLLDAALGSIKRDDAGRADQYVGYSLGMKDTSRAYSIRGEIRSARGDDAGALDDWHQSLILDTNNFYTLLDMGKYHLKRQEINDAVSYLDHAIREDPTSARAHHLRGLAFQAQSDYVHAVEQYRLALPDAKYTKSIPAFFLNFGAALAQVGEYEDSAEMLEDYLKSAPDDLDGHYQLGADYEILAERLAEADDDKYTSKAVKELTRVITDRPAFPMAHYYLSKAYRRLGFSDQADAEFELYERYLPQ